MTPLRHFDEIESLTYGIVTFCAVTPNLYTARIFLSVRNAQISCVAPKHRVTGLHIRKSYITIHQIILLRLPDKKTVDVGALGQ